MGNRKNTRPGPLVGGPNPRDRRTGRSSSPVVLWLFAVVAPLVVVLFRLLWFSYRFRLSGEDRVRELVEAGRPVILTCWHESVFVMAWYTMRLTRMGAKVTYLVSPSRDGDLVVRVLRVIGATVVRGSATRSGVKALHGLFRAIRRDNGSPLMLSDGPQGPVHYCKPGSVLLGQLSGAHILPIGCWPKLALRLRTWDRLYIPLPLTRINIVLGEPYTVESRLDSDDIERERQTLESRLSELTERARAGEM
jgi:lysophospholipid acyltransferase (LPLAT)-like uncharacterized protein